MAEADFGGLVASPSYYPLEFSAIGSKSLVYVKLGRSE
jgi:hypothetical protein